MFNWALKVEEVHANLYKKALQAVLTGKDMDKTEVYLCPVCGHLEIGKPTDKCQICGLPPEKFRRMD
jgi:rubrerythrin